jgi:SAM-dependent methyltransferase
LADGLHDRSVLEIIERDDGFIAAGRVDRYFDPFRKWSPLQRRAMRFVRGRVLDVGCGAGRVALYLQDRDIEVVAIDTSPGAVAVSRERGVRDVRLMALTAVNRRAIGPIDTVCLFGNNVGLLESDRCARLLFGQLADVTTSKGRILAESRNPYDTNDEGDLAYQERNRALGRLGGQVRMRIRHGHFASEWFDWLFVSADELRELVTGTGWQITRVLTDATAGYVAVLERA